MSRNRPFVRPVRRLPRVRGTSTITALLFGVVVAGFVVGTSGCSTGSFLYDLFKGDDDDGKSTTATEDAAVAAPTATTVASAEPVDAATGPCTVATRCATATSDAGVCSLAATCEEKKSDGTECIASWECAGGYCAWSAGEGAGVCASQLNTCRNTQTGCTPEDAHSCCEGSRCNPAQFGALPQCVVCNVKGIACDELSADTCCSGTCSFGKCQ